MELLLVAGGKSCKVPWHQRVRWADVRIVHIYIVGCLHYLRIASEVITARFLSPSKPPTMVLYCNLDYYRLCHRIYGSPAAYDAYGMQVC